MILFCFLYFWANNMSAYYTASDDYTHGSPPKRKDTKHVVGSILCHVNGT